MRDQWNAFFDEKIILEPTKVGVLNGLTFAVKDVISIKGYKNGAGNPGWLKTHKESQEHAPVVECLLEQGAKLVGTTQTDEIMYSLNGENFHYGTPVNPKDPRRIPGGSSSGSAVAVAAGLVDFALGTDTGGSVRIPSSYCGIYGFRPTHGAISVDGVIPLAGSFDTVGWMTRDPELLCRVGEVLLKAPGTSGSFTEMFFAEDAWELLDDEYRRALLKTVSSMKLPKIRKWVKISKEGLSEWSSTFRILQGLEIWNEHGEWIKKEKPTFGPGISERFQWTSTLNVSESRQQFQCRENMKQSISTLLGESGIIVIPTAPGPAPLLNLYGEKAEQYRVKAMKLSCIAGLAGLPQITLPLTEVNGLPVGLSFIANQYQDLKLLNWVKSISR
ncbi:amidase [Metabacillus sp. B2-18]|uniref:amidase n=1 Tax=Metabacillus sp. B2-18 TaxID=2897333 RepID=UPI001E3ECAA7|nr:amidase [Metabacillus sp. B2-18]UGB32105.1 amidase [Metabacillus sp. B2-18]